MAAATLCGCWVPNETGAAMRRDIRALETDVRATQKGIDEQKAQLNEQMQRAEEKIGEVDKKLQDLNRAARKTDAGFGVRLDEQQRELQELRGQIELLNYRFNELEKRMETVDLLSQRLDALENTIPSPSPSESKEPVQPQPTAETPTDKEGLLAHGVALIKKNKLEEARGALREVARKWPDEIGAADEAFFQIGETYFQEKKYRPALQEYIKVVEKFPKGKLADDAYYRIGSCSLELGNLEDALIFFEEVINNHPKSPLVAPSKKKVKEINKRLETEAKKE